MEGGSGDTEAWSLSEDYERLLRIETLVLAAVDISRQVCEELSKNVDHDNSRLLHLCSTFSENIETAQNLILEAAKTNQRPRQYDADNYQELNQGQVSLEQLKAMQNCIAQMESTLAPKK
eukprot:g6973.t1